MVPAQELATSIASDEGNLQDLKPKGLFPASSVMQGPKASVCWSRNERIRRRLKNLETKRPKSSRRRSRHILPKDFGWLLL